MNNLTGLQYNFKIELFSKGQYYMLFGLPYYFYQNSLLVFSFFDSPSGASTDDRRQVY